ncbi:MAG: DUF4826 family protein [Woeseiaceae bacterium]
MSEGKKNEADATLSPWARDTFDRAVRNIIDLGIIDGAFAEARPAWAQPDNVVIGQLRDANEPTSFIWVISGEVPTDHITSDVAATARDAARHFSLKWQMDAAHTKNSAVSNMLVAKAEQLYEIVEDDNLWQ